VRTLALAAFAALALSATSAAAADEPNYYGPARVRMPTGSILFGIVTELVPGQYVIILLPHGETRTIPWAALDMVHVRGYEPIGPGAMPRDTRSYEVRTAPLSFAPDGMVDSPAPPPRETEWAIGARGTVMTPTSTRSAYAMGLGGEANLVHWFAPELALYGLVEHVRFSASPGSVDAKSFMIGGGMRISGSATGTSALFDVATGYRVLTTTGDSRSWYRRGAIPLRLGAGLRFRTGSAGDVDLLMHIAPHLHPYTSDPACYNTCGTRTPSPVGFVGISLGMNLHV
jgi:hypothetical protein